ncbi:hypothetical protein MSKU15_0658 [Komagataeibacter diospyri]|nr:hypothetical protein MSKU15_0658 [Komagataeibacter diospyri]
MTSMATPDAFIAHVSKSGLFDNRPTASQLQGSLFLITYMGKAAWPLGWSAYGLATAYHETDATMRPITELGGYDYFMKRYDISGTNPSLARELGNSKVGDGALFCGRGYAQCTGRANYAMADRVLGTDGELIADPDRMLDPDIAARLLIIAMENGDFTGRKCADYLGPKTSEVPVSRLQFLNARRIINGLDCAEVIAGQALLFQSVLQLCKWH